MIAHQITSVLRPNVAPLIGVVVTMTVLPESFAIQAYEHAYHVRIVQLTAIVLRTNAVTRVSAYRYSAPMMMNVPGAGRVSRAAVYLHSSAMTMETVLYHS